MKNGQASNTLSGLLNSDEWSNAACCGYAILAGKSLGYTKQEMQKLLAAFDTVFSNYTLQEAEARYFQISTKNPR